MKKLTTNAAKITPGVVEAPAIKDLSVIVFYSFRKGAPLPLRLAAANDKALTEWFIGSQITEGFNITSSSIQLIEEVLTFTKAHASTKDDLEAIALVDKISETFEDYMFNDDLADLKKTEQLVDALAKDSEYTALMSVARTALHTGFDF